MRSVFHLSVTYIVPKSRTERPRKTKIGTEVGHVTRDSWHHFKVKRSTVNLQGAGHIVAAFHTACYNPNALSVAQPTVLEYWRKIYYNQQSRKYIWSGFRNERFGFSALVMLFGCWEVYQDSFQESLPHAGSGVVRIDPLHFLARCRTERLNQALSVLSLTLGFFWVGVFFAVN